MNAVIFQFDYKYIFPEFISGFFNTILDAHFCQ